MLIKHLEHLEDLIYNKKDFKQCMSILTKLNGLLFSQSNKITTKSDGCISIVFGIHPLSKQFFISTKSAFNKTVSFCFFGFIEIGSALKGTDPGCIKT